MASWLEDSPNRLAAFTCLGSVISVAGFYAVSKSHTSLPLLLLWAIFVVGGMFLVYWTPFQLREGIRNERWPVEQTNPLRRIIEHSAWKASILVLFAAMLFALLLDRRHHVELFWPVFILLQTMTQLSGAFRAPYQRPRPPSYLDWSQVQPLQSDHWGER